MSEAHPPVEEGDLHAYIDGQLNPERLAAVENYLAQHPDEAERVAAYRAQREAIRAAFAGRAEPLPPRLSLERIIADWSRRRAPPWLVAASVLVIFGIGTAAGWLLHRPSAISRTELAMHLLEQEVLTSHVVYSADQLHPVEVSAAEEQHLNHWLSRRLGQPVTAPDLTAIGYHLIGGRLLATEHGHAAALFMYADDQGNRVSLLLRPMAPELHARETDIRSKDVHGSMWIAKGLGIAVAAALPEKQVEQIASRVGEELHRSG
jgi:anti-sigma factor RsiW